MSLRPLAAALLPLTFALFLIAAPAVAGSDKDKDVDFGGNDGPSQAVPEPTALVVFGAGAVGGGVFRGERDDRVATVRAARDGGINWIDTAPGYGNGQSEENLAWILRELDWLPHLSTKVRLGPADFDADLDADFEEGTIHEFLMAYEAGRVGGSIEQARHHYERALELGPSKHPSIWLGWAESGAARRRLTG